MRDKQEIWERINHINEDLKGISKDQYPYEVYLYLKSGMESYRGALKWVLGDEE